MRDQLKAFAQRHQIETSKWDLLTGNKKDIYRMARNSFMIVATDGDGGPDDFIHSERLILVDKKKGSGDTTMEPAKEKPII